MLDFIIHTVSHTFTHTVIAIPFLFAGYMLVLYMERAAGGSLSKKMGSSSVSGPFFGALIGCIPQCGFAIAAADMYRKNKIKAGTLLAVFIAVSDEAIMVMVSIEDGVGLIFKLIGIKLVLGITVGILVNLVVDRFGGTKFIGDQGPLKKSCGCGCKSEKDKGNIVKDALNKALRTFLFLFIVSYMFEAALELLGTDWMNTLLLNDNIMQPFLAALIGFIPNCAASIVLANLFATNVISFGSLVAGLITSAGFGALVLLQGDENKKSSYQILGVLYVVAVSAGLAIHLFM